MKNKNVEECCSLYIKYNKIIKNHVYILQHLLLKSSFFDRITTNIYDVMFVCELCINSNILKQPKNKTIFKYHKKKYAF